jgi:hypothetical protein
MQNFHACRISSPDNYRKDSFKTIKQGAGDNEVEIIIGIKKNETKTSTQSVRMPVSKWSKQRAERWCKDHNGMFEPAKEE